MDTVREIENGVILRVSVKTNAKKNEILLNNDELIVKTTAPPAKGKANKMIIKLIAKKINLSSAFVFLVSGHTKHTKFIEVREITKEEIIKRLKSN